MWSPRSWSYFQFNNIFFCKINQNKNKTWSYFCTSSAGLYIFLLAWSLCPGPTLDTWHFWDMWGVEPFWITAAGAKKGWQFVKRKTSTVQGRRNALSTGGPNIFTSRPWHFHRKTVILKWKILVISNGAFYSVPTSLH